MPCQLGLQSFEIRFNRQRQGKKEMVDDVQRGRPFGGLYQRITNKDKDQTDVFKRQCFALAHHTDETANTFGKQKVEKVSLPKTAR